MEARGRAETVAKGRAHTVQRGGLCRKVGRVLPELLLFQEKLAMWGFMRSFATSNVGRAQNM